MKSKLNNKKIAIGSIILVFLVFNIFAVSNVFAATFLEDAVFNLDKDDPLGPEGYGAIIPSPNTFGTLFVDGKNQGKFTVTDWLGSTVAEEVVNYPGEDISLYYPTDLDNWGAGSMSYNDEIDPWNSVQWLNVSAYNAEAESLSPFTVSTVIDYYVMQEGGVFNQPFNFEHNMQVDVVIKSPGPKVLKLDWLTMNPNSVGFYTYLVSPSGKPVSSYIDQAIFEGSTILYNYLIFTANKVGAYRLLIYASHNFPTTLNLEFLDIGISSLPLNTVKFAGNFDDYSTLDVSKTANWQSNWYKLNGKKGDVFKLNIYQDFTTGTGVYLPAIDIWVPCANGYLLTSSIGMGAHDIYFPISGAAYISFTDDYFEDWYRYSLYLTKAENVKYTLGDLATYSISMDTLKTIEFSLRKDSIVRFNYTSLPNPAGAPAMDALGTSNAFIFTTSKEYSSYAITSAFLTRTVDSTQFRWYYMPAGTYKAVIRNTNPIANGIFKLSSDVFECSDDSIPVNTLMYPKRAPTNFTTLEFQPDANISSLKNPIAVDIEIPNIGQFRLNTTMWADENVGDVPLATPSHIYADIGGNFIKYNYTFEAFNSTSDYLYIAYTSRWTGMDISLSTPGVGGTVLAYSYTGGFFGWDLMDFQPDGTNNLNNSGIMEFRETEDDFRTWVKGTGGINIDDSIDENDYYWLRIDPTSAYSTYPIINSLQLTNITITGDIDFVLIGESGYEFDDYWGPSGITQPSSITGFRVSLDEASDDFGDLSYDTEESYIIDNPSGTTWTNGFEGGTYRLLIIPENWDYDGSVFVQFAVENYWGYVHNANYDIGALTPTPNLHERDITNYTIAGYSNLTGSIYDYGLTTEYNHTESLNPHTSYSYFALDCVGEPYQWTQLVARVEGLGTGEYNLYILQDLPWISASGPNSEVREITPGGYDVNRTFEFGTFNDHFTLLFEVDAPINAEVSFFISLSQYDTISLTTSDLRASYTPPLNSTLILALVIGIPAAVGVVVVIYVLKRKGKILTKRPL